MARTLYLNTNASSVAASLVVDANGFPTGNRLEFVLGDTPTVNLYLVDGEGNYDAISGAAGYTLKVGVGTPGAVPTGGTFTISDASETTSALAYNATAAQVQTALNALNTNTGPGGDTVVVTGEFPNYRIKWDTNGAQAALTTDSTLLTPTSTAVVSTQVDGDGSTREVQLLHLHRAPAVLQTSFSTIANGWSAVLNFNTFELRELIGTAETLNAKFEVEVTDSGGNRITHVQVPCVVRHEVVDEASLTSTTLATAISSTEAQNQFVQNRSTVTGLTGGTATDLDGIATTTATLGWVVLVMTDDTTYNAYRLVSGTDTESSPDIIRPDDYAGTTNEKVWKLMDLKQDHASTHITGGGDEIDGDKLDIDWTPSGYTPTTSPTEADNADNLTAHLAGVDNRIGARETVSYSASVAIDMDASPYQEITLTGNIALSTTNRAGSGRAKSVAVILLSSGGDYTITLDANIVVIGATPSTLLDGKKAVLCLCSTGSAETATIAAYAEEA